MKDPSNSLFDIFFQNNKTQLILNNLNIMHMEIFNYVYIYVYSGDDQQASRNSIYRKVTHRFVFQSNFNTLGYLIFFNEIQNNKSQMHILLLMPRSRRFS